MRVITCVSAMVLLGAGESTLQAQLTERNISLQAARIMSDAAIAACKADGYDVTAAVVDRAGDLKLLLRADTSNPHNADLARRKAYTARTFGVTSMDFAKRTADGSDLEGQRFLAEVVPLGGGLPIVIGTERIGGFGLSGAPDQAADEKCARAGLAAAASLLGGGAAQQVGPAAGESLSQSYRGSQSDNVEYQKVAPIKVFDNLYYVGPGEVSVWLIPTADGIILIDSAQEPLVDHVLDGIRKSGFDPRNIKYILLTHGHLDHFGGAGKIKAASGGGARVAALDEDWTLIEATYKSPGRANQDRGVALVRDMVLREGQKLTLGKTELEVYKMPGHTPGSAAFALTVYDNGRPHKALVLGGPGQRNGVEGGMQFLESIRRLKREFSDIEVPVHVHSYLTNYPVPSGGAVFEPAQRLAGRRPGEPHPFVDNAAWRRWLDVAEAGAVKYVEEQKLKAQQPPRSN